MSKKEKLIARLKSLPKDFAFSELETLLNYLGYIVDNKGKTSGSRVEFCKEGRSIQMHKPHGGKPILVCYLKEIVNDLTERGEI